MDRPLQRFRKEVEERLRILEADLEKLEEGSPEAEASVRRLGRSIEHSAALYALIEIREYAGQLDAALTRQQLLACARVLLEKAGADPAGSGREGETILIIEDEPTSSALLEAALAQEGRQILVAETAADALRALEDRAFDLIFLDLFLPDADGRDLLQRLRETPARAGIPVIVCSSRKASQAAAECLALGAQDYLEKPVRPDQVRAAAERQLRTGDGEQGGDHGPWANPAALSEALHAAPADGSDPGRMQAAGLDRPGAPRRVLLVEDDRVTARIIMHRLGKDGMEVVHADNGLAAHEAAGKERFDLAIFDVKLPGMDGFELLRQVRELPHFKDTPVIMLTSMGREADVVRGFDLGADDYVMKPFSPVELVARIHRLLDG